MSQHYENCKILYKIKLMLYHSNLTRILIISTLGNYFLQFNYAPQCDSLLFTFMNLLKLLTNHRLILYQISISYKKNSSEIQI
ncbi:hypothetical protein ABH916_004076 [Peribacillus frigoritolerans]